MFAKSLGILAFICVFIALIFSVPVPKPHCKDGWISFSIGRQGACSHHGGVKSYGHYHLFFLAASLFVGILTHSFVDVFQGRRRRDDERLRKMASNSQRISHNNKIDTIGRAISDKQPIKFVYITHGSNEIEVVQLRPVSIEYRGTTLSLHGHCLQTDAMQKFSVERIGNLQLLE